MGRRRSLCYVVINVTPPAAESRVNHDQKDGEQAQDISGGTD